MKTGYALYYVGDGQHEAKARAAVLRQEKHNAVVCDATIFQDKENATVIEFFGDVPDYLKAKIEAAYGDLPAPSEEGAVEIPEGWDELPFDQLQALASKVSDEPIRSKDDAINAINAYLESQEDEEEEEEPAPRRRRRK